jgi:hypothetical protein
LAALAFAISCIIILVIAAPAAAYATNGPVSRAERVKYYIVQPPSHGVREFLYEIAAKTLGNGKFAKEIFDLNKGRLEPGGVRFVNPTIIRPGWILVLPARAHGPGVRYGVLPAVPSAPTAGPSPPASSSPTATARPSASAALSPRPARKRVLVAVAATGGAVIVIVIIWLGLRRLRRRRRAAAHQSRSVRAPPAATWAGPVASPARPAIGQRAGSPGPELPGGPASFWGHDDAAFDDEILNDEPYAWLYADDSAPPESGWSDDEEDASWPRWLGVRDMPASDVLSQAPPTTASIPAGSREPASAAAALRELGADAASGLADETGRPPLSYRLWLGDDNVEVRLGRSRHADAPAAGYLAWSTLPYDTPVDGLAVACIGVGDQGCLFIDLAASPGVIAIGGDRSAAIRLAESVAFQLCRSAETSRSSVVLVGDVVPAPEPEGANQVRTLADLGPPGIDDPAPAEIVFCELRDASDAQELARYARTARHKVVPVVLADLPEAPWYLTAWPGTHDSDGAPTGLPSFAAPAQRPA